MCDCATCTIVNPRVHDFIIIGVFGGPSFNILTRVPFSNHNVSIAFVDKKKIINQVPSVGVGFMD